MQQGLQQVQESHTAPSSSAIEPEGQYSEEARQFILEVLYGNRERHPSPVATQVVPEQGVEAPEHVVEQPTEQGQQEGLQLSALQGEEPQQQELQPHGKRQRSPEREQQPAADKQQPAADDEQPARTDSAALQPAADHTQAVQQAPASHEGTDASSPRAAHSPKRRRKVRFTDLEGASEVRALHQSRGVVLRVRQGHRRRGQ